MTMKRLICGLQFVQVATLHPERDGSGKVRELNPKDREGRTLSDAPFCRFSFPTDRRSSGVYGISVDDRMVYIGKTNNLSRRFGPGEYGDIVVPNEPNSQVTNRRVNHGILEATRRGSTVDVWFHETHDRDAMEALIIGRLDLTWNREAPCDVNSPSPPRSAGRSNWSSVIREAEAAKAAFVVDRRRGEALFAALIKVHSSDGMVWLKRAQAYEEAGDADAASADFARAEALLPFESYKAEARAGLVRTRGKR